MLGSEIDISNLKLFKNEICPLRNHLSFFSFRQNSKPFVFLLFRQTTINLLSIRQNKAMRNSQQRTTQSRKLWSSTVLHISSPLSSAASFASHFASVRPNRCPAPWPARYRLRPHRRFSSSFGQLALVGTLDVWPLRGTAVSCTPHQTATIRALALALCLCSCDHKSHYQARADHVPVLLERDLR